MKFDTGKIGSKRKRFSCKLYIGPTCNLSFTWIISRNLSCWCWWSEITSLGNRPLRAWCASSRWYMNQHGTAAEWCWQGNPKDSEKLTCHIVALSSTSHYKDWRGQEPGPWEADGSRLSCGTVEVLAFSPKRLTTCPYTRAHTHTEKENFPVSYKL